MDYWESLPEILLIYSSITISKAAGGYIYF
jgi:hypothetical protein